MVRAGEVSVLLFFFKLRKHSIKMVKKLLPAGCEREKKKTKQNQKRWWKGAKHREVRKRKARTSDHGKPEVYYPEYKNLRARRTALDGKLANSIAQRGRRNEPLEKGRLERSYRESSRNPETRRSDFGKNPVRYEAAPDPA